MVGNEAGLAAALMFYIRLASTQEDQEMGTLFSQTKFYVKILLMEEKKNHFM
jgi:hypothetical protein